MLLYRLCAYRVGQCPIVSSVNSRKCLFPLQGVLIVGERGTGKTSLALAIAAEARVPVVNVEAQELEAGLWVGQSAANVRELFQTARDLVSCFVPNYFVRFIIFIDIEF